MTSDVHRRASRIFLEVVRLPLAERSAFLRQECGEDLVLRSEVESLLEHDPGDDSEHFANAALPDLRDFAAIVAAPPSRIGRFRIEAVLGRGGMGVVYRARQDSPDRLVAVKVLAGIAPSEAAQRRFEREAEALGRLQHPGIAQIYEAGNAETELGAQPFFAMEYVEGAPITAWADERRLDDHGRIELWIRVCLAVEHAHERGIVHRDLKPANILVDGTGQPKVLDFGVARFLGDDLGRTAERTLAGNVLGTIAYMSPEQASGRSELVDERTDVHALGVIGYELLSHRVPRDLDGMDVPRMLAAVGSQEPVPLARRAARFRGDLDTILAKALATDPRRRYRKVADLAADLERYLRNEPISARPHSSMYRVQMAIRRNRGLATGLGVAALVLVAGTVTSIVWALRADREAKIAREERRSADLLAAFLRELFVTAAPAVARGQVITAQDLVSDGHDAAMRVPDSSPLVKGRILSLVGGVERSMGQLGRAAESLPQAVAALRAASNAPGADAELGAALHALGELRFDEGKFEEAESHLREALTIRARVHGERSLPVGEAKHALAVLANVRGRFEDSLRLHDEAAELLLETSGASSARYAMSLDAKGSTLNALHRKAEAAELIDKAVQVLEALGPTAEPQLASSLANLAIIRVDQGRSREAGPLFRKALDIGERIYPPNHPALIVRLTNLATLHATMKRYAQAEPLLRRALAIHEASHAADRRATAHTHLTLGQVQEAQGNLDEALTSYAASLAMFERLAGPDALDGSEVLESIGRAHRAAGRHEPAVTAYERALRIREKVLGETHPALRNPLEGLASCAEALGRTEEHQRLLTRIAALANEAK